MKLDHMPSLVTPLNPAEVDLMIIPSKTIFFVCHKSKEFLIVRIKVTKEFGCGGGLLF